MAYIDFPIYFNETKLFEPTSWDEVPDVIENVYTTEAGYDQIDLIRTGKITVSAKFQCSDKWAAIFAEFSEMNSFTLKSYDVKAKDYKTRTVRMRDFDPGLKDDSHKTAGTNGLYEVTFNLKEF